MKHNKAFSWERVLALVALSITLLFVLASTAGAAVETKRPASGSKQGGSLNVLESSAFAGAWIGLDPATDVDVLANSNFMSAIYGGLFQQGPNGRLIDDLATGYTLSNGGKTVTIRLRHGVTFQDGTPFTAQAVAFNFNRDLQKQNYAATYADDFPISSITTPNNYTVVLQLSRVFPIINAIPNEPPDFIVSPTALNQMGEQAFSLQPVGAGPFKVTKDVPNSLLVVSRNSSYWQHGLPKLSQITFTVIGSDESAYDAMVSGQAQVYQGFSTVTSLKQVESKVRATKGQPTSAVGVQFNTALPPFNNILAREAVYYATNAEPINKAVYSGLATLTESPTGPGGLFFEPHVPGYRKYDLKKAKALVKQLGGLNFTLLGLSTPSETLVMEALKSEWAQAGIQATLSDQVITNYVHILDGKQWQVDIVNTGSFDPALGFGLSFRFTSDAPVTGVHDPALDQLITEGTNTVNESARARIYAEVFKYISDKAYAPFLFAPPTYTLTTHAVSGPGLTDPLLQVLWQDVSLK